MIRTFPFYPVVALALSMLSCAGHESCESLVFREESAVACETLDAAVPLRFANAMLVHENQLIVADFGQREDVFHVFDLSDGHEAYSFGAIGKGHGELIRPSSVMIKRETNELMVYDGGRKQFVLYSLKDKGETFRIQSVNPMLYFGDCSHVSYAGDDRLVGIGFEHLIVKGDLDAELAFCHRFPKALSKQKYWRQFYDTWTCTCLSPDGDKFAVLSLLGAALDVYDIGPDEISWQSHHCFFPLIHNGSLAPTPESWYGFRRACASDHFIYTTLLGVKSPESLPTCVCMFDWSGNPVRRIDVGHQIENMAAAGDSCLYLSAYNGSGELSVMKVVL